MIFTTKVNRKFYKLAFQRFHAKAVSTEFWILNFPRNCQSYAFSMIPAIAKNILKDWLEQHHYILNKKNYYAFLRSLYFAVAITLC